MESSNFSPRLLTSPAGDIETLVGREKHGAGNTLIESWLEIVQRCSTKQLTKEEDRLPALSGIAKRFQDVIGGR